MPISDMQSLRANVNEAGIWLASIWSWLTPWPWWFDLAIVIVVGWFNWTALESAHHRAKRAGL